MKLLIDGDIVAYRIASACEEAVKWEDDLWTLHCDANEVNSEIDNYFSWLQELITEATGRMTIALTGKENFRKDVSPLYKANRKNTRKPVCLKAARQHMIDNYDVRIYENIEADDVLSMFAGDDTIIVSPDKDLRQVPGYHFIDGNLKKLEEDECLRWFYTQTLVGDTADNYKGCPGVGPVKAERLLTPSDGGSSHNYWMWKKIVGAYEKAGLTEEDALENARLAYLLKDGDYNYETKEVTLWQPPTQ